MRGVRSTLAALCLALAACSTTPKPLEINAAARTVNGVQLDPQGRIDKALLTEALSSYARHWGKVKAQRLTAQWPTGSISADVSPLHAEAIGVIDFRLPSTQPRFFLIRLSDGAVSAARVGHGEGSGLGDTARYFTNQMDSRASSVGAYAGANIYEDGAYQGSLRLHGLDQTNACAFYRAVVLHEAGGMTPDPATGMVENSDGCLTFTGPDRVMIAHALKNGGFIYAGPAALHTPGPADACFPDCDQTACEKTRLHPEYADPEYWRQQPGS